MLTSLERFESTESLAGAGQPSGENNGHVEGEDTGADSSSEDEDEDEDEAEQERSPQNRISRMIIIEGAPGGGGIGFPQVGGPQMGDEEEDDEIPDIIARLEEAQLPEEAREVADRELKRLQRMSPRDPEYSTLIEYLNWMADLPWSKCTEDRLTIRAARDQLEADHFGMQAVKSRILEYLSVCKLKGDMRGSILCFHGPPGIGKTSLGKSIADSLNRDFYRVSLGGVHTEAEVRGHRRAYVGAMPGLILQALKKCGTNNCVIMLDEIDKLGQQSHNGDPSAALLEVLDPEQNQNFRDHFLNHPFNLSRVLFIATANDLDPIPRPLLDRMEVIEMSGYTVEEKVEIARRHLLPKQRRQHGLGDSDIQMEVPAIDALISGYTREAGVRELDRKIGALCRFAAARVAVAAEAAEAESLSEPLAESEIEFEATIQSATDDLTDGVADAVSSRDKGEEHTADTTWTGGMLHEKDLVNILGPPIFDGPRDNENRVWKAGIATGLAYTPVGGDVLFVEAETMSGRGELTITGSVQDVMAESVKIATGWVRAHAKEIGIPLNGNMLLNGTDLHIHFPAGAVPKDGPSAGVTITTAIVSLLTGREVRPDLAMTGEISLRGLVLPVGGIKEKLIAAHRAGMKHVLIPAKNVMDLRKLPASVLDEMKVTPVKDIEEVLAAALQPLATTPQDQTASSTEAGTGKHAAREGLAEHPFLNFFRRDSRTPDARSAIPPTRVKEQQFWKKLFTVFQDREKDQNHHAAFQYGHRHS